MKNSFSIKSIALFFVLATAHLAISAQKIDAESVKLRRTKAQISNDGKIEIGEWRSAAEFSLTGGGKVFLLYNGEFLQIAVRGVEKGWCHLYLTDNQGETIKVLHTSAALGMTIYRRAEKDLWQPENPFAWNLREKVFDENYRKNSAEYLVANGWRANNNNLGNGSEIEFSVKIDKRKRKNYRIAVVYTSDGKNLLFFPAKLADDALNHDLIYGKTPHDLIFETENWSALILK